MKAATTNVEVIDASLGRSAQTWRNAFEWIGDMSEALVGTRWEKAKFDIIAVDGLGNRVKVNNIDNKRANFCVIVSSFLQMAKAAAARLKVGGVIVLDNTGWYPNAAKLLREEFGARDAGCGL
eukprot:SAG31_NODE_95_length_25901_cov_24.763700_20_plen_123_part_00